MPRLDTLTLKQLRAFAAVCDTGSLSRAADQLSLSPPAVHTQIKSLETTMNCRLLDRTRSKNMTPTDAGLALLRAHDKVIAALEHAVEEVRAANAGLRGFVRVGVVSTGKYFAPKLLAMLEAALPNVRFDLFVGNRQETIDALASQRLDLAVMGRPPRMPGIVDTHLGPNPHVLVCPPAHRFAQGPVTAEDILDERIIFREAGSGTRILTERFLDRIGPGKIYDSLVMDSNETIKQAVMAGLGIAILSAHTLADELIDHRLVVVRFDTLPIMRAWYLVRLDEGNHTPVAQKVEQVIKASCAQLLQSEELAHLINGA